MYAPAVSREYVMVPNNYLNIVQYNNKSALTRVMLSTSWNLGATIGLLARLVGKASDEDNQMSANHADISIKTAATNISIPAVNGAFKVAALTDVSLGGFPAAVSMLNTSSLIFDAFGFGTGKSFGGFRAGYQQGKIGFADPSKPKEPELIV